jgi:cytochrome oxidase Cu insertion factor (SCO1/SenC/PrrC family)
VGLAWIVGTLHAADASRSREYDYEPPAPGTYALPVIQQAGDGDVLDIRGHPRRLRELVRDRVTVMSFIYSRCAAPLACPHATGVLKKLHAESAKDPGLAANMRLVSMSFDPVHDTPLRLAAYAALMRTAASAAEWRFVTAPTPEALQPILESYGQAVSRKENPLDPTGPLNHTLRVFLIDRQGRVRNIYSTGTLDARLVLADVRTLLMEKLPTEAVGSEKPSSISPPLAGPRSN